MPTTNGDLQRRYQAIVSDARYRHFTRIPERIARLLDRFQVDFNRAAVQTRLLSHYLFIAVVDDAIDSGEEGVAQTVFDVLTDGVCISNEVSYGSDVAVVTAILKSHFADDNRAAIRRSLQRGHREVIRERAATSIGEYIKHRKILGRVTAKQSYLLIRSELRESNQKLCCLMEEIGAVGCLVDTMIDIHEDHRSGLLSFELTTANYATLCFSTVVAGLCVLAKKPTLIFLLAEAVLDNIRDRGRVPASVSLPATSSLQHSARSFRDSVAPPL
jgi:hypothetical protein